MMHKQLALLYAGRKRHDKLLSLASAWYFRKTGHKIIPQWERRTSSFLIYFTKGESAISSLGSSFTSMVHQQKPLISPYLGIEPWKKRSTPCWGGIKKTEVERDTDACKLLVLRRGAQTLRWSLWTFSVMELQAFSWHRGSNTVLGSHFHLVSRTG